jgi:MFS family permease
MAERVQECETLATGTLALALLPAGWLSDSWGRTRVMTVRAV